MTPEGKVKEQIHEWFRKHDFIRAGTKPKNWPDHPKGWYYMPVQNGMGVSGIPDFVGCYNSKFISIEAKAPGKVPTANQEDRREEIGIAGGIVAVVRNSEDLITLEKELGWNKVTKHCRKSKGLRKK